MAPKAPNIQMPTPQAPPPPPNPPMFGSSAAGQKQRKQASMNSGWGSTVLAGTSTPANTSKTVLG